MGGGMVNTCSTQKTGYNLQKNKDGHHPPLVQWLPASAKPRKRYGSGFFVLTWHSAGNAVQVRTGQF